MVRLSSTACAAALVAVTVRTGVNAMFSVQEDLLAYPQYEVRFPDSPDSYITEEEADRKIAYMAMKERQQHGDAPAASSKPSTPPSEDTDVQTHDRQERIGGGPFENDALGQEVVYEAMRMNGKRYICSIPVVQPPPKLNATERRKNKSDEEKELARATVVGTELLRGMEGTCLYFISGWWSYSFCYGDYIKQFHQLPPANGLPTIPPKEDPTAASYILGRAAVPDRDAKKDLAAREAGAAGGGGGQVAAGAAAMELQANGELKYLVQKLAGGTLCDITGKERRIELQYHCAPHASQDRIGFIKEVTTCCYLMVVYTPRLCSDPAFQPPADSQANTIECVEVMNEARIREYRAEKERKEQNLQSLLDLVGIELNREMQDKLGAAAAAGGKDAGKGKMPFRITKAQPNAKPGQEGEGGRYMVVGRDGREQMVMVEEFEFGAEMLDLPEGQEIDMEEFARMAVQAGARAMAGDGEGGEVLAEGRGAPPRAGAGAGAGAGGARGAAAPPPAAGGHDEL
ncbi:Protein OS-9 [Orbilia brochopaga]|uniref:Endoplasmic reticulum lectin n=1 Tax=Orbilia brochopaga TaxID=3140254 RepID=A0AAV9U623_9PEZI